jgi:hypothetical protein
VLAASIIRVITLMMEAVSKVNFYQTTRHNIQKTVIFIIAAVRT